jgi:uncharacterized protein YegL
MFRPEQGADQKNAHIVFLCDASGSMSGERIANMNDAISAALATTKSVVATLDHSMFDDIDVSAIRFSDTANWHTVLSKLNDQFAWNDLNKPQGITNLGQAYSMLDKWLTSNAADGTIHTLIVVLVTDGMPTDEPSISPHWLKNNAIADRFERIAFALGSDAESSYLDEFVSNEDNLYILTNESMLKELLSRALTKAIRKTPGNKQRQH